MKTIDVTGYSGEWVLKALAAQFVDGEVALSFNGNVAIVLRDKLDNETRLVQAAAKLKGIRK